MSTFGLTDIAPGFDPVYNAIPGVVTAGAGAGLDWLSPKTSTAKTAAKAVIGLFVALAAAFGFAMLGKAIADGGVTAGKTYNGWGVFWFVLVIALLSTFAGGYYFVKITGAL